MTNTRRSSLKPFSVTRALITFAIASGVIFGGVQVLTALVENFC